MSNVSTDQLLEIALAHHQANRLPEAERVYRQVLEKNPNHADALHFLGVMAGQIGRYPDAIELLQRSLAQRKDYPETYVNLALVFLQTQQPAPAAAACREALRLRPGWLEVLNILGNCEFRQGHFDDAIAIYQQVLALNPDFLSALSNLGAAHKQKGDLDAAADCCRKIFQLSPVAHEAHNNLGIIFAEQGKIDEAVAEVRRALEIYPDYAEGWNTLGRLLHEQGRLSDELACYQRAMACNIQEPAYHGQLANALLQQGRVEESIDIYQRVIALAPGNPQAGSNLLFALNSSPTHSARDIYDAHVDWARRHADTSGKFSQFENGREPDRPIRLGYVSPNLSRHPVASFLQPVLALHDRGQVEVFCYSGVTRPDDVTERLRALPVQWRETAAMTDEQLCSIIREDRIDILVDLAGHSAGNRLLAFAHRPAPIQVSWLGYPNTTGMSEIDFRITDGNADPPRMTERFHTETLVRLPEVFLCFQAPDSAPEVSPPPSLRNGRITFGSFANLSKLNAPLLKLWSRVLHQVPGSRLLLKSLGLGDEQLRQALTQRFAAHNLPPDRLELRPFDPTPEQHFNSFADIDITLDTFPYNGTTTTCESLWMGVPVVTLRGESHRSRVGTSLLETIGLPTQIATSQDEYARAAVDLANDVEALRHLRSDLREKMRKSPLMDAASFTAALEREYRALWQRWCGR